VRLATEGADIIALDLCAQLDSVPYDLATKDDLDATVDQVSALGRRAVGVVADVRDYGALDHAISSGLGAFGRLDIVLANAGIAPMSVKDHEDAWQDVIDVNLTGARTRCGPRLPSLSPVSGVVPS
jgi:NAD(P)-dependent dehydrogenase (short-subunit alcohol dehydrogenase family)